MHYFARKMAKNTIPSANAVLRIGLHENLRGRAGIAPDRFRSLHADETDAEGRAERRRDRREGYQSFLPTLALTYRFPFVFPAGSRD